MRSFIPSIRCCSSQILSINCSNIQFISKSQFNAHRIRHYNKYFGSGKHQSKRSSSPSETSEPEFKPGEQYTSELPLSDLMSAMTNGKFPEEVKEMFDQVDQNSHMLSEEEKQDAIAFAQMMTKMTEKHQNQNQSKNSNISHNTNNSNFSFSSQDPKTHTGRNFNLSADDFIREMQRMSNFESSQQVENQSSSTKSPFSDFNSNINIGESLIITNSKDFDDQRMNNPSLPFEPSDSDYYSKNYSPQNVSQNEITAHIDAILQMEYKGKKLFKKLYHDTIRKDCLARVNQWLNELSLSNTKFSIADLQELIYSECQKSGFDESRTIEEKITIIAPDLPLMSEKVYNRPFPGHSASEYAIVVHRYITTSETEENLDQIDEKYANEFIKNQKIEELRNKKLIDDSNGNSNQFSENLIDHNIDELNDSSDEYQTEDGHTVQIAITFKYPSTNEMFEERYVIKRYIGEKLNIEKLINKTDHKEMVKKEERYYSHRYEDRI